MRAILFGILLGGVCCNLKAQSTPEEKLMQTLYANTNLYVILFRKRRISTIPLRKWWENWIPFLNICLLWS